MAVRGVPRLRRALRQIGREVDSRVDGAMDDGAEQIKGASQALVPERSRRLLLSATVTKQKRRGRSIRVISYDTPYAVRQHEDDLNPGPLTSRKAPTQDGPPGRKYLERPFTRIRREILIAIGAIPIIAARGRL